MDKVRALVSKELEQVKQILQNLCKEGVDSDLKEFLLGDSKYIRSILGLLYLKAHNVKISSDVIKLLSVSELVHNASLLHDDVIDESNIRRGIKTVFNKAGAKLSILYGDFVLSISVEKLLELNNHELLKIYLDTTKNMSLAEIYQFKMRDKDVALEDYIKIAEGKTALLFKATLEGIALLSELNREKAAEFGRLFGLIFQMNNDLSQDSIINDKKNGVKTINDILTVEKNLALKDNYIEELRKLMLSIPQSEYKKGLEDLIKLL